MKAGTKWGDRDLRRKLEKLLRKGKKAQAKYHLRRLASKRQGSTWNPGYLLGLDDNQAKTRQRGNNP